MWNCWVKKPCWRNTKRAFSQPFLLTSCYRLPRLRWHRLQWHSKETDGYCGTFKDSQLTILTMKRIWLQWHSKKPSAYSDTFWMFPRVSLQTGKSVCTPEGCESARMHAANCLSILTFLIWRTGEHSLTTYFMTKFHTTQKINSVALCIAMQFFLIHVGSRHWRSWT